MTDPRGERADQDQAPHPVGVGGGVQAGEGAAFGLAEQDGLIRMGGIQHEFDVAHPALELGGVLGVVGQARSSLVEEDHPAELRQVFDELAEVGTLSN